MRWKSVSRPTLGWIAGTIWIAEAPVPTTATRLPVRSRSWSHWEEWKTWPGNSASPGSSGTAGSESGPVAETRASAVQQPRVVVTRQRACSASQRASMTSWLSRRCGRTPKVSVTRSR